jgi:hypothetical protein
MELWGMFAESRVKVQKIIFPGILATTPSFHATT